MRRAVSALVIGMAALGAAILLFGWVAAPAARPAPGATPGASVVAGAFHVHTQRSDGTGTLEDVAAAAGEAGLRFVILADHGDGTRPLDQPAYRSGVLCIDGVEISTGDGHYIAVGLRPSPYSLAGRGHDVIEDVKRLGGFGIVAHPTSARPELSWRDWSAPFDAMEWLNADSEWRDENLTGLLRPLVTYPFRPVETLTSLFDRSDAALVRWHELTGDRRVVALAGADAHARLSLADAEDDPGSAWLQWPTYEELFRAFTVRAILERELTGDAEQDAALVMASLREGRIYTVIDGLAPAGPFTFRASSGHWDAVMGEMLPLAGPVVLSVESVLPSAGEIVLLRGGKVVATRETSPLSYTAPEEPATYWAEVRLAAAPGSPPVPWILTNPIYVGMVPERSDDSESDPATPGTRLISDDEQMPGWSVESDATSRGAFSSVPGDDGRMLLLRAALGAGPGPFTALARQDFGGLSGYDGLTLTARTDSPLRLSIQVRLSEADALLRWQQSVYLDRESRTVSLRFEEMEPVGHSGGDPPLEAVETLLFVVESTNMPSPAGVTIRFEDVRLERQVRTVSTR